MQQEGEIVKALSVKEEADARSSTPPLALSDIELDYLCRSRLAQSA